MSEYEKILSSFQSLCVKRECCSSEIRNKAIKSFGGDTVLADRLLSDLVSEKYLDDARYASAFAREKSSLTGWGPAKISLALRMKGIEKAEIEAALSDIDQERAGEKLEKLLRLKSKSLSGDPYIKFKLIKYALSRGYGYDRVETTVNSVLEQMKAEI